MFLPLGQGTAAHRWLLASQEQGGGPGFLRWRFECRGRPGYLLTAWEAAVGLEESLVGAGVSGLARY